MNWSIRNDAPVYTQLVDQIARAIILGQFPPGSKLPSVRDFASDAGVNRTRCSARSPSSSVWS
ncbi:MAG: GntR family transcriptional regulator [Oscillospiraceae bacterium]